MNRNQSYVCIGYGSNLCDERFLCYIRGRRFKWGGKKAKGCTVKTLPSANKPIQIPHRLYFAKNSCSWEDGGVAFVDLQHETEENNWTVGRMWKITCEQYEEVRDQESKTWYNHEIYLGEEDGFPIRTVTNKETLTPYTKPSKGYLKTIALGLKETYSMRNEDIVKYFIENDGIRYTEEQLIRIIESATSSNSG